MFIICIFTRLGLGRRETRVKTEINQITGDDNGLGKEVRTVFRTVIMGRRSSQKKSEMIWSPPPRPAPNSSQGEGTLQSLDFSGHHAVRAGRPRAVLRGIHPDLCRPGAAGTARKNGGKIAQGPAGARAGKSRHNFRILL